MRSISIERKRESEREWEKKIKRERKIQRISPFLHFVRSRFLNRVFSVLLLSRTRWNGFRAFLLLLFFSSLVFLILIISSLFLACSFKPERSRFLILSSRSLVLFYSLVLSFSFFHLRMVLVSNELENDEY